jgi:excisionase family DNA binding protein
MDDEIFTVDEFAKINKTTRATVLRWIKSGKILAYRLSDSPKSSYRIRGCEIHSLITYDLHKTKKET